MTAHSGAGPLAGVRIADFTLHAAGPFCTHMLVQLGAESIKIESAVRPDIFRRPHPVYGRMEAAQFDQTAAGKRSITLNLKDRRAADIAKRLVAVSDIVVESFRPGVLGRLGLGFDDLKQVRPDVVLVSISSSGQTGPDHELPGYASLFSAWGGLGHLTGFADGPPVEIRHVMDHSTGLAAAMAGVAALHQRRRTGQAQHVDVAAREIASALVGDALLYTAVTGGSVGRQGNDRPYMAPYGVYPCAGDDRWVSIAVRGEEEWRRFAEATGRTDWLQDPRFSDGVERFRNRQALDAEVSVWTRGHTTDEVEKLLQNAGVPAMASHTNEDVAHDAHLRARGVIGELSGPAGLTRTAILKTWRFSRTDNALATWTPELGEGNRDVLGGLLGMSLEEIDRLQAERVVY